MMALGPAATPPKGFVEFCERSSAECGVGQAELKIMTAEVARQPASPAAAAIQYDWSEVFAKARAGQAPSAPRPMLIKAVRTTSVAAPAATLQPASTPLADGQAEAAAPLAFTPDLWKLITETNDRVNRAIAQRPDIQVYGVAEYWNNPLEHGLNAGDCEDFVLEKRHGLIAAGVPATALSIAVVTTPRGETHAVLLVATSRGEFVLDSLTAWVLPWDKTPYRWRERQVAGSAPRWAMAATDPTSPTAPAPALLFASLR